MVNRLTDDEYQISIPAPARGATSGLCPAGGHPEHFNSRPRTGGDSPALLYPSPIIFQFPPPHGGRQHLPWILPEEVPFQFPPPHGGRQYREYDTVLVPIISIPAPARGATVNYNLATQSCEFQFPPPHGGRRGRWPGMPRRHNFNSRPRTGGDLSPLGHLRLFAFQFPPPHGGRQQKCPNWIGQFYTFMLHSIFPKWQKSSTLLIMPELCA